MLSALNKATKNIEVYRYEAVEVMIQSRNNIGKNDNSYEDIDISLVIKK